MANDDLKQMAMKELATREMARRSQANPDMQGGATSPANIKAQADLKQAQGNVASLDPQVGAVGAAYNATWPVSMFAKKAMGNGDIPVPEATTSGGKMLQDVGMLANPLAGEAIGLIGKGLSKIPGIATVIPNALKYSNPENESALAKTIRSGTYKAKTDAVNSFGDSLDALAKANPDKSVSLRNVVDQINQNMSEMAPEAKNVLRRTPILKDLLVKPELADNVPLRDTQDIINYINTKVPRTIKANHLDILDTLNDTRAAQLDAFPELADVRSKYGEFKNSFDAIKGQLKQGSLIENMTKGFGDSEMQGSVRKVMNEDMLKKIKDFQEAKKLLKVAGIAGKTIGYGALAGAGFGGATDIAKKLIP